MTVRNLDAIFKAGSLVLIGASPTPGSIGSVLVKNLKKSGFKGGVYYVNPKYREIAGQKCYQDLKSLPLYPELAVLATPPEVIPDMIAELAAGGTRGAIIITAGFEDQNGVRNQQWKQAILNAAQPHLMRVAGPNCLGVMVPGTGMNASFGQTVPLQGGLAFVAQSGAVLTSVLDWATSREIGFSHFVSLGDMLDVDFGDMLDYLAADGKTRAILMYIEAITHSRKFMSAARAAARIKPVIVVKSGRFAESARAAASHTGALAGIDGVYDAAFRRAGILRVMDMEALFTAVETLAVARPMRGDRLAILTNGGGVGVLATDTLIEKNGHLAELSVETIARLSEVLPPMWSHTNPVDIIGDADGERYHRAMSILIDDKSVDGILVLNCPTAITSSIEAARAVIDAIGDNKNIYRNPPILAAWMGDGSARESRTLLRRNHIPCYETPGDAVRGFMQMVRYQHSQEMLLQTVADSPENYIPDVEKARTVVKKCLDEGRNWLQEGEAKALLASYDIPVVASAYAATVDEAVAAAQAMGGRVVLKIISPDILHKSEVGGVALGLDSPEEVRFAATRMINRIVQLEPAARIEGFTIQQFVAGPYQRELIIGAFEDDQFGPVLLFGHGGTAVEVIRDKALTQPPLNMNLAREVIENTRVSKLLKAYRNVPAADIEAVALTLLKISQMVCDIAEIKELDINPLLANEKGVLAVDARIRIVPVPGPANSRLAILPYPRELEQELILPDGQKLLIRPVKPEDENGFITLFNKLSAREIHMRFLHPMKTLSHDLAARLTQIDYDREMALVLEGKDSDGGSELFGGVRISADPDNYEAEFAILLRGHMTGIGLGPMLLRKIIDYSRNKGIRRLFGEVLVENSQMLKLARALGFSVKPVPEDSGIRLVELEL